MKDIVIRINKKFLAIGAGVLALIVAIIIIVCGRGPSAGSAAETDDGTYYWSSYHVSHTIVVKGSRWTSTSIIGGERTYEYGTVRGGHLYDSSGYFEVGRISHGRIYYVNHTLVRE